MKQYTGRTLDEVLNSISTEQGCRIDDITYNILEEEKGGIFGLHKSITIEAFTSKDVKEFIFDYLGAYFTELNQGVSIEIIVDKENEEDALYRVILDAENNAIIIGKNGQTLRAISTVLKAAVNATFKKRINVIVDVNHYKEDRYKKVKAIARREAINVAKTHVDCELDPMPNDERKVIHQYLQDFKNVSTVSIGEGNKRHLCIKYTPEKKEEKEA
ncbi:MAG: KH domain-containing protein [Erysipelotrichaceae bacterium]|nr:KH domain-containing protein [Erysipelotrichaceae bacterium]MBR2533162.1 KH domain-containing protein [Erysipelotrichaceae bacterium]